MPDPLLHVHLNAAYKKSPILRDLRFDLAPGEILGLVGSSGAGKSTLVLSLLGLLPWRGGTVTGEILFQNRNLLTLPEHELRKLRGRHIALIPQSPMSALNSAVSIQTHFDEAWRAHETSGQAGLAPRLQSLILEVQLPPDPTFLRRKPSQISVGQAQRVLIALALLHRPSLLIADEPTSALDPVTQNQILTLLRTLSKSHGTSLLYVSHDLVSVLQLSDRIAILDAGTLVEILPTASLIEARHPATLALLRSLPAPPDVLFRFRNRP